MLYNFGASKGDTWRLGIDTSFGCDTSMVIVDSVGSVQINGNTHRWISLSHLSGSYYRLKGKITERFGSMEGYFFPITEPCDSTWSQPGGTYFIFNCFEDNSFPLYNPTSQSCEHWKETGISDNNPKNDFVRVYPNPATEKLHIKLTEPKGNYQIQIFDATGKKFTSRSIGSGEEVVDISALPKGIYLVLVTDGEGNFYSQKVIRM